MSLHDVGETAFVSFWTRDAAGAPTVADTVSATLTPVDPPGPPTAPTISNPAVGSYTVAVPLPAAGEYALRITATVGGSVRVDDRRLAALPEAAATLPAWAPSLTDVADHIPTRTRPTAEWGASDAEAGTFTEATTPTRDAATRLIRRACAWVAATVGAPVSLTAYPAAGVAAALRAAYWVELAYPERDADLAVYDRLREESDAAASAAHALNVLSGAEDPSPGGTDDLVTYEFPDPPPWADRVFL